MAVKGVFASDQGIIGDRRGDFASGLLRIMPTGRSPLLALSAGMERASAMDVIITWFEENHIPGRLDVASFVTDGDGVGIVVDDASAIVAGTILLVESSGEYVYVATVVGNTITVERGFAGTTPVTIVTDDFLQRIGTAFEEGSARPTAVANLGFPRFNFCQIFRNTWDVTRTARQATFYTGDLVAKNKADAALFHAEDIERSSIWGVRSVGIRNSKPFRTLDGINQQIVTNVTTAGATTSWAQLRDFLRTIFERNVKGKPNERIAFCGNTALSVVNDIALNTSQMNIEPGITEFGMNVNRVITPFGTIVLMTHPLMVESPHWTTDLYVYHPGVIRYRYYSDTSTDDYDKDGSRAGIDADFGVFTTELSIEYRAELTGGQLLALVAADNP